MTRRTPLYVDCDTGVDDAIALAYLAASPSTRVVGIGTVSGNTSSAQAARNTRDLLALLSPPDQVRIAVGAHDWLNRAFDGGAPQVHGSNGIGEVALPPSAPPVSDADVDAARLLIDLTQQYTGELEVLAIGPLTNLALALEIEPRIQNRVARVTIMGGAVWVPGNVSAFAEANIANDPEAAHEVFSASWPITLVPLDVTMHHRLTLDDLALLAADSRPGIIAVAAMLDRYMDFYEPKLGVRAAVLHDPLAAAIATGSLPSLRLETTGIRIVKSGTERGRTEPIPAGRQIDVITGAPSTATSTIVRQILSHRD